MQIKKHTLQTPYPVGPVHFYTFETDEYTLIFDTGPRTEEASEYLAKIFDNKKQKYLFITHCHVDHYGMLDFFEKRSDTEIFISKYDLFKFDRVDERLGNLKRLLAGEGFPEDIISSVEGSLRYFKYSVPFPKRYNVLEENEKYVSELGIAFERCPGHSQSDILYKIGGSAVSGDIILRNIFQTPLLDMDFHDIDRRFRNYNAFINSALKLKKLKNYNFLPGHRDYIDSVDARIRFYASKVKERSAFLQDIYRKCSVFDVVKKLVDDPIKNPFTTYIKASETFFIKDYLSSPDKLDEVL